MATIQASSVVSDLTSRLYTFLAKETSFARRFETDSSNTSAVKFDVFWKALTRSVNQLDGLSASTAELNKLDGVTASSIEIDKAADGIGGYAVAAASSRNVMAGTKRAVTGSTNMNLYNVFGITTLKTVWTQLAQSTNPGANFVFTRSSYCCSSPNHRASSKANAGTLLVKVYKPTASSITTPIPSGSAVTLDITAWGL